MLAAEPKVARAETADSLKANLNRSWKHLTEPLESFLQAVTQRLIEQVNNFDPKIVPYAQYALNGGGKTGGKIDGGGRLPNAALLIGDRNDFGWHPPDLMKRGAAYQVHR